MALLDFIAPESGLRLNGQGVRLRPPKWVDHQEWMELRQASRAFLQPWEPTWGEDDLTRPAFRRRLASYQRDIEAGVAFPFFVFREEDGALVGGVTLSNVRRGVAQMGSLGYWVGQAHAGRGYATAAVRAMVGHAFDELKLHRVEAACVPANIASRRVLEKSGFVLEGQARAYLKINGAGADHLLFGIVNDAAGRGG